MILKSVLAEFHLAASVCCTVAHGYAVISLKTWLML